MLKNKSKKGKPVFAGFPFLLSRSVTTDTDESKEDLLFCFLSPEVYKYLKKSIELFAFSIAIFCCLCIIDLVR